MRTRVKEGLRRHRPTDILRFAAHLPSFARLFLGLFRDHRVAGWAKLLFLGAWAYVFSPADFLPDLMPVVGQIDDLALLAMAGRFFIQMCPTEVVREHVARIDTSGKWTPFQ